MLKIKIVLNAMLIVSLVLNLVVLTVVSGTILNQLIV